MAGNGGGLAGFKDVLEIADQINALRGDGKEDDSWLGLLKSVAPGLAQAVTQLLLTRNVLTGGAAPSVGLPNGGTAPAKPEAVSVDTVLPTAYDQVAGQLRGLLERLQAQVKAGLDLLWGCGDFACARGKQ